MSPLAVIAALITVAVLWPTTAQSLSWPYTSLGDDVDLPGCCHTRAAFNIKAPNCQNYSCGGTTPGTSDFGTVSTAAACCALCEAYQPELPKSYGGLGCNAWTWCANPDGCQGGTYEAGACFLKYVTPPSSLVNPPFWTGDQSDWASGTIYADELTACLVAPSPVPHYCRESFAIGYQRPDGTGGIGFCSNGCNHCPPDLCQYFNSLPPFTGSTYPGSLAHSVGSTFECCPPNPYGGTNPGVKAFYGGPTGSSLILQKQVTSTGWVTVATAPGGPPPTPNGLCFTPASNTTNLRLIQVAAPGPADPSKKASFVVWLAKRAYLGTGLTNGDSQLAGNGITC